MQNTTITSPTTINRFYEFPWEVAAVIGRLKKLNERAAKKGLNGSLEYSYVDRGDRGEEHNQFRFTLTITFTGDFALGDYRPVAVIDFTSIDEGLVMTIDPEIEFGDIEFDPTRCDHCNRNVKRNKTVIVADPDGELIYVGGNCAQDFLGRNPDMLTGIAAAIEIDDDKDRFSVTRFPTRMAIAAAIKANRLGFLKSSEPRSTKWLVEMMLTGNLHGKQFEEVRKQLDEVDCAEPAEIDAVIGWMLSGADDGDFGRNMRKLASADEIGIKALGYVAYAPAGLAGWRDKMAELAAKRAAEAERKAQAEPVPVTDKRIRIEGVITTKRLVESDFGTTTKIRVETDAGWACWGTIPSDCAGGVFLKGKALNDSGFETSDGDWFYIDELTDQQRADYGIVIEEAAERGDRIAFDARIEVSDDDELFGFFSRPTKGTIVAREEVAA